MVSPLPAATAVTAPCTRAVSLSDEVIDPTSYEYVPYAAANMSSCYLGRGMSGSAVTALQKDLISCYGYKPATDGVYGELTESAVVAVQKRVGVKADGDYGSSTRDAMKWANCSLPTVTRISCTWRPVGVRTVPGDRHRATRRPERDRTHPPVSGQRLSRRCPDRTPRGEPADAGH